MVGVWPAGAAREEMLAGIAARCREVWRRTIAAVAVIMNRLTLSSQSAAVEIFAVATFCFRLNFLIKELCQGHCDIELRGVLNPAKMNSIIAEAGVTIFTVPGMANRAFSPSASL